MNYRIAVCDDDAAILPDIKRGVLDWAGEAGHCAAVETFPSAEAFLFRYEEERGFDMLLLDIEMGRLNGVELAKRVRADNREIQIIFVTGYADYIADGYEVEALHYLMKPVAHQKLCEVLDRAAAKLLRNERALHLNCADGAVRVPLHEIAYLEVRGNYVTVHAKEEYTAKMTLGEAQRELDERFFRTGRSYILNLNDVRRVSRTDAYMKDGTALPLPRGAYEALNRALIRYL